MNFLRKLFGPKRPHLGSLHFDTLGWPLRDQSTRHRTWEHPTDPALLSVDFFELPPDLPHGLDPSTLRSLFRKSLSQQEGGLLEVSRGLVGTQPLVRTLFKLRQQPSGMGYVGSLILPFQDCSYVVKVQAWESGMTGLRESFVAEQLMQTGQLQLTEEGYSGWFADPYDPYYTLGTLMNRAEQPEYDDQFPGHPLTLVRQSLRVLEASLQLQPELLTAAPF
ncbi:hypothetical protein LJ737_12505 [Hymenobacter sp. 15J16-1T3B]|uniref:hypothetical protein n=1 Tax=Hymenobacter sp. 15J16-1T3B TaxID=2886941 RepID=UPI001D1059C3|nr:hypothetical protein [Hymenobacter sp. 15J16-1T3B]MCC3158063.1 hypothetical protein [Hymenobacter sp. 15J16-1T3B]